MREGSYHACMSRANAAAKAVNVETLVGHPTPEDLARFMRGELSDEDPYKMFIVRHLLTRCPQCCAVTRRLWRPGAQKRSQPRQGEAARTLLEMEAQKKLLDLTEQLEGIRDGLRSILAGLPPEPAEEDDEEEASVTHELRAVIECVVDDSIQPAIANLRAAAVYPQEPPEEDDHRRARRRK